ncbi:hypothetical protein N5J77_01880 [Sphingobium yanoikuyae]|uniref:Uncharacterized protein n=1 Tax=Sphingobium yanoikuyae TaxID=13690 RepID=A0AA42WTF4_SPHYA|nr:hypothetical protein [Sphingobium yanoikuyae]MDH2129857.1 hypothetical protein [Sphingobium yanoikuyae]MDH2147850.1 hypothetical protein [Sphingobium yanoikuyae]MDH2165120.1 hypothetical protein [Sphingobium yanoikuyae]
MQTAKKDTGTGDGRQAVRMYPNNQLKAQVRDFNDTLSAFHVIAAVCKAA